MRAAERGGFSGPALIDAVVATACRTLGPALVGVYLHGSWCLGGFDPRVSDLDYVMVVRRGLTQAQKRALMTATMQAVLPLAPAKGLEFHVLTADAARHFRHPCPFDLHFSPLHEAAYRRDPAAFVAGMHGTDPDLAAHLTVLRQAGQCAWGQAIAATFGPVPVTDYWASVMGDVGDAAAAIAGASVYTTLNLCRTLAFARTGSVMGKAAGGKWAADELPQWQDVVAAALAGYRGQARPPVARERLVAFADFALARLAACPAQNRSGD